MLLEITPANLVELIERHLKQVNTTSLDLSFNEILDMHERSRKSIYLLNFSVCFDGQRAIDRVLLNHCFWKCLFRRYT